MDLRNKYQEDWSNKFITLCNLGNTKGIFHIFQRVGKIRTTLLTIDKLNLKNPKILVTYPDNSIKDSWLTDIEKFGFQHLNITYCNHASLDKYIDEKWDVLVKDEIHSINSDERIKYSKQLIDNTKYVIGLSGTISDNKRKELKSLFDLRVIIDYTKEEAIEDGIVADYEIEVRIVNLDNTIKTKNSKGKLVTEAERYRAYSWLIDNKRGGEMIIFSRNRLLQQSIAKKKEILKCLQEFKNQRVIVFTGFNNSAESLEIPYYHSKCKNTESLDDFNSGKYNHLALSVKGQVGVTYKNLDIVILSNFVTDSAKNEQGLTRSSIKDYGSKVSKFIIICTNTESELKKLKKTLQEFDIKKIKYIYGTK